MFVDPRDPVDRILWIVAQSKRKICRAANENDKVAHKVLKNMQVWLNWKFGIWYNILNQADLRNLQLILTGQGLHLYSGWY